MGEQVDRFDLVVARLARRQHGVVTFGQLTEVGMTGNGISQRAKRGQLHRLYRGVYAVGHLPTSRETGWMAAVFACGEGAVLSHRSAATLWGLLRPHNGPIEVSTPARSGRRKRAGIQLHRCASLRQGTTMRKLNIPVTTPARTISDLRGAVRWTVDFLWRQARLVVETDSYLYHRGRIAFQDDHARDLDLRRQGFTVRRFDERQIGERPEQVAADLRAALKRAPGPGEDQQKKR